MSRPKRTLSPPPDGWTEESEQKRKEDFMRKYPWPEGAYRSTTPAPPPPPPPVADDPGWTSSTKEYRRMPTPPPQRTPPRPPREWGSEEERRKYYARYYPPPPKPQVLPNPSIFGVYPLQPAQNWGNLILRFICFCRLLILDVHSDDHELRYYARAYLGGNLATLLIALVVFDNRWEAIGVIGAFMLFGLFGVFLLVRNDVWLQMEVDKPKGKRKETDEQMATLADLFDDEKEIPRAYRSRHPGWFSNCECGLLDCVCHLLGQRPEAPPPPTPGIKK